MSATGVRESGRCCPDCGAPVPASPSSCPECGAVLAPSARASAAGSPPAPARDVAPAPAADGVSARADAPTARVALPAPGLPAAPPAPGRPGSASRSRGIGPRDRARDPTEPHATPPERPGARPPTQARASFLSDLPFERPGSLSGWLAALGAWCVVLSFPLPWASSPFLGWFAAWGFNPTLNLVPFALALTAALASITPSRVPVRVRLGYSPFATGLAGLGLAWGSIAYLGAVGAGLWLLLAGSLLAAAGGLWALLAGDRVGTVP